MTSIPGELTVLQPHTRDRIAGLGEMKKAISSVFIARFDHQQRYLFVNEPYAERFGLAPAECVGKQIHEIVGAEGYASFHEYIDIVLSGQRVEFEVKVPYSTIGPHYIHCSYDPEFDQSGQVIG